MKRRTYTVLTVMYLIILYGAIHSTEMVFAQAEGSPAEPPAQHSTEQPSAEQPSGEIQERAIKTPFPELQKQPVVPLPTSSLLPGHFGFMTWTGNWITAVGGGGRTGDAFHTDATQIQAWEKFRLLPTGGHSYAIVTPTGNYVTAVDGGNRIAEPVLQSAQTQVADYEKFLIFMDYLGGYHSIRTISTKYLTAVGGGGKLTNPFHTDAVKVDRWENLRMYKCGELGSGYQYAIVFSGPLRAIDGGGRTKDAVSYALGPATYDDWSRFKLIRQSDGFYAFQTSNGINYVTAVNGGGVVMGPKTPVVLQTNRTQVQAWEKFRIVDA